MLNAASKVTAANNYKTISQAGSTSLHKNSNIFTVMETPPMINQKGTRSSSSEVRTNQIDFSAMARNRLQTQSNKKNVAITAAGSQQPSAKTGKTAHI